MKCDIGSCDAPLPESLHRFVREASFAQDLLAGRVWISTLEACRKYERLGQGDPGEAKHDYNTGGLSGDGDDPEFRRRAAIRGFNVHPGVKSFTIWGNEFSSTLVDAYVLCLSDTDDPYLRETFGNHRVSLSPVSEALIAISEAMGARLDVTSAAIGRIRYRPRYSEGDERSPGPIGFVKPEDPFAPQREWRMLWTVAPPHDYQPFLLQCDELAQYCHADDRDLNGLLQTA